jgi:murein DD-endopeptidase MepM/ murein hydrolase activator NlpD
MKHRVKWISLLALVLVMALALGFVGKITTGTVQAASSSELEKQLEELEKQKKEKDKEIAALQSQIDANADQMTKLVQQKNVLEQEMNILRDKLQLTNSELSAYSLLIADKQEELEAAQERLAALQEENKLRIRAMEKNSRVSFWSVLFSSNSFMEYLDRMKMISEIREEDNRRLQEMKDTAQQVEDAKAELVEKQAALEASRKEMEGMQVQLQVKREEADGILIELKKDADALAALHAQLEDEEQQLLLEMAKKEDEIDEAKYREWLATAIPQGTGNTVNGITWVMPTVYKGVSSPFGMRFHPIDKVYKMHQGVDFPGTTGTPVVATRSGVITTATFHKTCGNHIWINHGDGYKSVYMHLDTMMVSVGQYVVAGQQIGTLGNTGGSTGPHLHFGVAYNGNYIDPLPLVKK